MMTEYDDHEGYPIDPPRADRGEAIRPTTRGRTGGGPAAVGDDPVPTPVAPPFLSDKWKAVLWKAFYIALSAAFGYLLKEAGINVPPLDSVGQGVRVVTRRG